MCTGPGTSQFGECCLLPTSLLWLTGVLWLILNFWGKVWWPTSQSAWDSGPELFFYKGPWEKKKASHKLSLSSHPPFKMQVWRIICHIFAVSASLRDPLKEALRWQLPVRNCFRTRECFRTTACLQLPVTPHPPVFVHLYFLWPPTFFLVVNFTELWVIACTSF